METQKVCRFGYTTPKNVLVKSHHQNGNRLTNAEFIDMLKTAITKAWKLDTSEEIDVNLSEHTTIPIDYTKFCDWVFEVKGESHTHEGREYTMDVRRYTVK